MSEPAFKISTHLSIAWGVTLAILTLLEWRSLDRDPMQQQILTPFIERVITVQQGGATPASRLDYSEASPQVDPGDDNLQYIVQLDFNGPLFLACFFIPVLAFRGIEKLLASARRDKG